MQSWLTDGLQKGEGMEVTTQYAGVSYAGYYATKTTSTTTFESTIDAQGAAAEERM